MKMRGIYKHIHIINCEILMPCYFRFTPLTASALRGFSGQ